MIRHATGHDIESLPRLASSGLESQSMLTTDIHKSLDRSVLCWLATSDRAGVPNVSPKEIFAPQGPQHLLIANIASPCSVRNIKSNPQVCISFIDIFSQKGYKLHGKAEIVEQDDPRYPEMARPLEAQTKGIFPIQSIIAIQITSAEPVVAPSYKLVPGTTEASQIEGAMRTYGVTKITDAS